MVFISLLALLALGSPLLLGATASPSHEVEPRQAKTGKTLTSWDCCKPACAWSSIAAKSKASGSVKVCGKDNRALGTSQGNSEASSCDKTKPGNAYLCADYSPRPVADDLSYAFAITDGSDNCCKCFELQWTDGPSAGKRLHLQVINEGGKTEGGREWIILTPGGGVGPNTAGCNSQFGYDWGRQYGGVVRREDCDSLPDNLQGGCYWRYNWARGDVNGWNVTYTQINCPDYLSGVSGCRA